MARLPPQGGENACGVLVKSFTLKGGVLNPLKKFIRIPGLLTITQKALKSK